MNKEKRIRQIIKQLRQEEKKINVNAIITASLFSAEETLDNTDTSLIDDIIWEIKNRIIKKVEKAYPNADSWVSSIEVNAYFNPTL